MSETHADYDPAEVTPSEDDEAVGRVGGVEDETFSREDGAEARNEQSEEPEPPEPRKEPPETQSDS